MPSTSDVATTQTPTPPGLVPLPSRPSLSEDVYEVLKASIMDNVIPPGGRLSIDQLARDLGVSATPMREALVRLESEGLVQKEPLRGYTTTPLLTVSEVHDLFEFRSVIEPWSAARAAERLDADGLASLQAEMASVTSVPDGEGYAAYRDLANQDERFHRLIAELSGNGEAVLAFTRTHCHLRLFRLGYTPDQGDATLVEHRAITAAISARDADRARIAMANHLEQAHRRLGQHQI